MNKISEKEFNFKGGVLIIGSLLWQDYLNKNDTVRKMWRENNLLEKDKILVKAPIRYGRRSSSGIYTMTFSNSCSKNRMGTCYLVPLRQTPTTTFSKIKQESEELSNAEGMKKQFLGKSKHGEIWSALGILINQNSVERKTAQSIYAKWKKLIDQNDGFNPKDFKIGREKCCINKFGKLNFDWPIAIDKRNEDAVNKIDFIIATVTRPTNYPKITELAEKVNSDTSRYYFIENYKAGITTFQDIGIINKMPATNSSTMQAARPASID